MWVVEMHPEVRLWLIEQDGKTQSGFLQALQSLREKGPNLGRPLVDTVVESKFKNLKELRPGSSGASEIRALFAFDPRRKAIILVAGDKSRDWTGWYRENIRIAETRLEEHLENESQD